MKMCDRLFRKFTLTGQDSNVKELRGTEVEAYQSIYNDLIEKLIETGGDVPNGRDVQVINKIVSIDDEYITPVGLVNVSLESLAKLLTFARSDGIKWQVDIRECTDTHFKELSYYKIKVDCTKDIFCVMASGAGFRYPCESLNKH